MLISYDGDLIASPSLAHGRVGPFEISGPNGEAIIDEFTAFRASVATLYGRGRKARQFSFKVNAFFNTEAELLTFQTTHEDDLELQADLVITDDAETVTLTMADAVVSVQMGRVRGVNLEVTYTFRGAKFVAS